ncbi:MAG: hypothetical protein SGILL_007721, partial [Bacillariaceae sp.]
MAEYYSDEDSSLDTPPPPPPSEINVASSGGRRNGRKPSPRQSDDEKYHEQLNLFRGMFNFQSNTSTRSPPIDERDEEKYASEDDDDESAAPPPPPQKVAGARRSNPFWKREIKKPFLYGSIAVVILLIIIIILSIGIATKAFQGSDGSGGGSGGSSSGPNYTPEETERAARLREYLMTVGVDESAMFADPISAESQALAWMQYEDPAALDPIEFDNQLRIDQRFALLTLWFESDKEWFNQRNWLSEDECTWHGVTCILMTPGLRRNLKAHSMSRKLQDGDKLVALLDLENNNLSGEMPADLGLLQFLKTLNLSKNELQGEISSTISSMDFIEEIYLNDNRLTGQLALDFSSLPELTVLDISNNNIGGPIPQSMWQGNLQEIMLDDNDLVGSLADDVENLDDL